MACSWAAARPEEICAPSLIKMWGDENWRTACRPWHTWFHFCFEDNTACVIPSPPKVLFFCVNANPPPKMQSYRPAHTWLIPGAAGPWLVALPGAHLFLIHSGAAAERPGAGGAAAGEGWAVCRDDPLPGGRGWWQRGAPAHPAQGPLPL